VDVEKLVVVYDAPDCVTSLSARMRAHDPDSIDVDTGLRINFGICMARVLFILTRQRAIAESFFNV
jgi:hypothetical protein